uniref:Protein arginine N-methyltransferase n=1 Tax=Blastobotrys adeninivorans TaxID=409370 RepID=A0A060TI24_BLAAD
MDGLYVGLNLPSPTGAADQSLVDNVLGKGYDMITCRITSRGYRKRIQSLFHELEQSRSSSLFATGNTSPSPQGSPSSAHSSPGRASSPTNNRHSNTQPPSTVPPPGLEDVVIHPGPHTLNTIALASPWVELDSKNPRVAKISFQVLEHELSYASFCGLNHIVIPGPKRRTNVVQYAHAVNSLLQKAPFAQLMIHLPFTEQGDLPDPLSIWDVWQTIRHICAYSPNLSVALQVPQQIPRGVVLSRWFAEPVSLLVISPLSFVPNQKQYPVLPKPTQKLLWKFFKKTHMIVIEEATEATGLAGGDTGMLLYLRHLHKSGPPPSIEEQFAAGYLDYLQSPLQPLADNLESSTYEVFERDPIKYSQYEKALYHAFLDKSNKSLVVAVVGAGRGPLVDRAIRAAAAAGRTLTIYALEKNVNAIVYLQRRKSEEWGEVVTIVSSDMRDWVAPKPVDVIVSELLGSFGDNELSPECLDGAQKALAPNGVMIPQSYSAHLTPVMSPKLYQSVLSLNRAGPGGASSGPASSAGMGMSPGSNAALGATRLNDGGTGSSVAGAAQSPYVVMLHEIDYVSGTIAAAWRFKHPVMNMAPENEHNTRMFKHTFSIKSKCNVHGLAGFFETVLYKDIELSTKPDTKETKSKDMVSWFPMWFPLSQPMYLTDNSELDVSMWRQTDGRKVWYEWAVESYALVDSNSATSRRIRTGVSNLHNSGGKYFAMIL